MIRLVAFVGFVIFFVSCKFTNDHSYIQTKTALEKIDNKIYYYPEEGGIMLDSLKESMEVSELVRFNGELSFLEGHLLYNKGFIDSSLLVLESAHIALTGRENTEWLAKCQLVMGWIVESSGYWEQAKISYFETLGNSGSLDTKEAGLAYLGIGRCKQKLGDDGLEELKNGIDILSNSNQKEFVLYAELNTAVYLSKKEASRTFLKTLIEKYLELGLNVQAKSACKQLATSYNADFELDSAIFYIYKGLKIDDSSFPEVRLDPGLFQLKGLIFLGKGRLQEAEKALKVALNSYNRFGQEGGVYFAYKGLYKLEIKRKNYFKAASYNSKASAITEKLRIKAMERLAIVSESTLNNKILAANISRLESEKRLLVIVYITLSAILLLLIYLFFARYKRGQERKQELVKNKNSELQKLIVTLGERRYLEERLGVKRELVEADANDFEIDKCYPETILQISNSFPNLSTTESRYALMFALGMDGGVIAEIQSVEKDSVRKVKQRIRKKIDIDKSVKVEKFFQDFVK